MAESNHSGEEKQNSVVNSKNVEPFSNCGHNYLRVGSMIRSIRGQQVMLDSDLAKLYGVDNKRLKEQVNRNLERFPADFMFELTWEEFNGLRSQIATSNKRGGTRYLPYAFTRNGISMLSSVLRSKTAIEVNILIMRAFTAIPQIVNHNAQVIQRIFNIEHHQLETDEKIEFILKRIEDLSPKPLPEHIFQTGCVWDAWTYVSELVRNARQRIILIDNYVDERILSMLSKRADGVSTTIHTRYNEPFLTDLKKHNSQYPPINYIQLSHRNHDRFIIIDDKAYLMGSSLKDLGIGLCAITELETSPDTILGLLK